MFNAQGQGPGKRLLSLMTLCCHPELVSGPALALKDYTGKITNIKHPQAPNHLRFSCYQQLISLQICSSFH
jgi:hypothetical protein